MRLLRTSLLTLIALLIMANASSAVPMEGQPALDFNLPELNDSGKTYSLKDYKGKVVLLNIWASWCTGCQAEMPEFLEIQEKYKKKPFLIVAVSVDSNKTKAVDYLKGLEEKTRKKINFTVLYDKDQAIAKKEYKPRGMPASYLLDKNGTLKKIFLGSFTAANINALTSAIEEALK